MTDVFSSMKGKTLCISLLIWASLSCALHAQKNLILNGSLEDWTMKPPRGKALDWGSGGEAIQNAGLVPGSAYAAVEIPGTTGFMAAGLTARPNRFELRFVLAATRSAAGYSSASFQLVITALTTNTNIVNLRTVPGTISGRLTLEAADGSSTNFVPIAPNALLASEYDEVHYRFTKLNPYDIGLIVNIDGAKTKYSLSYGPAGGKATTLPNLTYLQDVPSTGLANVSFLSGTQGTGYYGFDNVSLVALP